VLDSDVHDVLILLTSLVSACSSFMSNIEKHFMGGKGDTFTAGPGCT